MSTLVIILLFIFFCCGPFYMLIAKGIDKAEEKDHGGCVAVIIILLVGLFTIGGCVSFCNSIDDSSPSYDYYDHVRK